MKALTEKQIETINELENYKQELRTKYYGMYSSMQMLAATIEQPSEKANELMSVVIACHASLEDRSNHVLPNKEGVLVINEVNDQLTPIDDNAKKNRAIRILISTLRNFSFEMGRLMHFMNNQNDIITMHTEMNTLHSHIDKVIEIILEQ